MKRLKATEEAVTGVNVVPIIDVTLVLLVVLLVMSPIVNIPSLPVDLPEAMTKETKDQNVTVSLSEGGAISVDSTVVEWDDLPGKLRQTLKGREDVVIIVRADKNLPYGIVENLIKTVNRYAGKFPVAIATKQRVTPINKESFKAMNTFAGLGMGLNRRDTTCLMVALAVHSLLLLWKGGLLTLPSSGSMPLGDPLLEVGYMSDVPEFSEPGAPGEEGAKHGILGRVKRFFAGSPDSKAAPKSAPEIASGESIGEKIKSTAPAWEKADQTLVDKNFSNKKNFKGIQKQDDFAVVAGKDAETITENRSVGSASKASPMLKEKSFQVSKRDMPFQVASSKEMDTLSNVNMVPVTTSEKTSPSVSSMDSPGSGGVVGGAALKSKSVGSSRSGTGGFSGSASGRSSEGAGNSLAMGSASGGGMIDAGGMGSGYAGSGTGGGGTTPGGMGKGKGGGRGNGGGSPYGVAGAGGGTSHMLPRRGSTAQDTMSNSSTNGETITGELSRRPIKEKFKPPYEMDARVALRFRVNASGRVLDGIVVEVSSGSPTFDNKVIAALKQWIFSTLPLEKSNVIQEGVITFVFRGE